jgi:hypothetical protein
MTGLKALQETLPKIVADRVYNAQSFADLKFSAKHAADLRKILVGERLIGGRLNNAGFGTIFEKARILAAGLRRVGRLALMVGCNARVGGGNGLGPP